MQLGGFIRRGQRIDGLVRIELAGTFAADHEVAILLIFEPGDVGFRRDPGVHDDQRALWRGQVFEHVRHCRAFGHIAGEHLRSAHEPAGIEHQTESDQRAIRSFLFRAAARCLGVAGGGAFEVRVGEIVERDGDRQTEQILNAAEQRRLDFITMAHEKIGGPVELHQGHCVEVHAEQFAEDAAFAQPAPYCEFTARRGHTPDQTAGHGGPLNAIETEVREDRIDAQPAHRGETGGFHAGGTGLDEL